MANKAGYATYLLCIFMRLFLNFQGHLVKNWKRRWFVLRNNSLYYYASKVL